MRAGSVALLLAAALGAPLSIAARRHSSAPSRCVRTDDGSNNPGGVCGPYRYRPITDSDGYNTYVLNDMWNPPGRGHPQTIRVDNPGRWTVTSDQARGNTAVLAYPDVQQIMTTTRDTPAPLARFAGISSDFTESMPSGGDNEAAYDIWMGAGKATDYAQEVMIWVDDHRTNPPPGHVVARPVFDGQRYAVWRDPTGGGRGFHTLYAVRDGNETSGRVDILAMLRWLVRHRLTNATGLNQIDFGWEICSTGGRRERFTVSHYDLRLRCRGGGSACYAS